MTEADPTPRYLVPFDTFRLPQHLTDVLVVGRGVAGLSAALAAADAGQRVTVLSKGEPDECNTAYAQGGIAAVLAGTVDSSEQHARDTLKVGQGLCDRKLVEEVTAEADEAVRALIERGAQFDGQDGVPALGLEGGHSTPRVLHARGDSTGAEIRDTLSRAVGAQPLVDRWSHAFVLDLLTDEEGRCRGALVDWQGHLRAVWAGSVVLASGGYAQVFRESTNVAGATGDGAAAAWRAGAKLADLEFVQFHPTTLYLAGVRRLLLTEAIRGEGAYIVDDQGERFLVDELEGAELAPRDRVSQAIIRHIQRPEIQGVYLDLTHLDAARVAGRFPRVVASCKAHGLDITKDRIPIRPAAHYSIGGVMCDGQGATDVPGLYVAGEIAASGMHGANRLASNSLLEGLVLGGRAGRNAAVGAAVQPPVPIQITSPGTRAGPGYMDVDDLRRSLEALMWFMVGIERHGGNLAGALGGVQGWEGFALRVGADQQERLTLLNMLLVSRLLATSALLREESRGTHYRRDFRDRDDENWRVRLVHERGKEIARVPGPPQGEDVGTQETAR